MRVYDLKVELPIEEVLKKLDEGILLGNITERLDYYEVPSGDKGKFIVVVYGKHYYRANNRLTLTICLNDINGITNLHAVGINEMGKPSREDHCNVIEKFIDSPRRILGEYIK